MATVYPFKKYNYNVLIDDKSVGHFSEVSAPNIDVDPIEYREGNHQATAPGRMPGFVKFGNVTLKWGMADSQYWTDWFASIKKGDLERKNVMIELLGDDQKAVARWQIFNAWPVKWSCPDISTGSEEIAVESLELAHEGLNREV